jgi:hypothetical protein
MPRKIFAEGGALDPVKREGEDAFGAVLESIRLIVPLWESTG